VTVVGLTAFCRAHGVRSEAEYKRRCRDERRITYHAHLGLHDWAATADALRLIEAEMTARGHRMDRYGLCLSRSMSVPEARRSGVAKETGPRLEAQDWTAVAQTAAIQPHLGDFMIGTPAGMENTGRALAAGITTIGNLGQFFGFETPGGADDAALTDTTVRALGVMSALKDAGALVHSYLDDGPAMQLSHYGAYAGWAALELYAVEELIGARLAHCFGGLVPEPAHRAILAFALDDLRDRDSLGSMVYGNTVDYTADRTRNAAVLANCVLTDVAVQLRRPTGHAINPVPLTEAERIPSAGEIVEAHLLARELEREARRSGDLHDWTGLERTAAEVAAYARAFRDRALTVLQDGGVDVRDARELLLALRRMGAEELESRAAPPAPPVVAGLETWKRRLVGGYGRDLRAALPRLDGLRVVLAVLEVHDVVRDALAAALPRAGAQVVVLASDVTAEHVAAAAVQEDADAVVIGTYNGVALTLARELTKALRRASHDCAVIFGGRLNEDMGEPLPTDVRPHLERLGVRCVDRLEELGPLLLTFAGQAPVSSSATISRSAPGGSG
jgi:methylmalonyl-CoA mutase cobalamin-binding subunit